MAVNEHSEAQMNNRFKHHLQNAGNGVSGALASLEHASRYIGSSSDRADRLREQLDYHHKQLERTLKALDALALEGRKV